MNHRWVLNVPVKLDVPNAHFQLIRLEKLAFDLALRLLNVPVLLLEDWCGTFTFLPHVWFVRGS